MVYKIFIVLHSSNVLCNHENGRVLSEELHVHSEMWCTIDTAFREHHVMDVPHGLYCNLPTTSSCFLLVITSHLIFQLCLRGHYHDGYDWTLFV